MNLYRELILQMLSDYSKILDHFQSENRWFLKYPLITAPQIIAVAFSVPLLDQIIKNFNGSHNIPDNYYISHDLECRLYNFLIPYRSCALKAPLIQLTPFQNFVTSSYPHRPFQSEYDVAVAEAAIAHVKSLNYSSNGYLGEQSSIACYSSDQNTFKQGIEDKYGKRKYYGENMIERAILLNSVAKNSKRSIKEKFRKTTTNTYQEPNYHDEKMAILVHASAPCGWEYAALVRERVEQAFPVDLFGSLCKSAESTPMTYDCEEYEYSKI